MRAVNLLPRDAERQPRQGGRAPLFVAAGGVAAVLTAAITLTLSASATVGDRRADLEATEASIAALRRDGPGVVSVGALSQERADRVAALSAALGLRVPFDRLLHDIAYVLPEDAWLTGLTAAGPERAGAAGSAPVTPTPAAATQAVEIQGATYSQAAVARVLARLSLVPSLSEVRLGSSTSVDVQAPASDDSSGSTQSKSPTKRTVVTFLVVASLSGGGS